MKKKSFIPQTRVKNPEPKEKNDNWIIWAAWADRITLHNTSIKHRKKFQLGRKKLREKIKLTDIY